MSMGHGEHEEWYFKYPSIYRLLRIVLNGGRFTAPVEDYLQTTPEEKVVDVGCGVGDFSKIVKGHYEGYDLNKRFVQYAQEKFGTPQKSFYCQDALSLPKNKRFDKGIIVNILHHFDDQELDRLLSGLKNLVTQYFVITDADWDASNRFQQWLLKKDQGSFFRSRKNLMALISRHFEVKDFDLFETRSGSVQLFRCRAFPI